MPRSSLTYLVCALQMFLLAGCAGSVSIPPSAIEGARISPSPLEGRLILPPSPTGKDAIVIVLHGCEGLQWRIQQPWVERLASWGYGAFVLDSFSPRGVPNTCTDVDLVSHSDRAGDVITAARWLQSQPGVDGSRIAVLGTSHGGATAATLINQPFARQSSGLIKAAVDYYGSCHDPQLYGGIPFLALVGSQDTEFFPAKTCSEYQASVPPGSPVLVKVYNASHGFDRFDPAPASMSFIETKAFLARTIGPDRNSQSAAAQ